MRDAVDDPGARWMVAMRRGDFAAAWRASDEVLRAHTPCWHLPRHEQWVWDGTPLDGKRVLIRCYHGLGDTLQFIRYAPLVQQIAAEVTVWAQPALRQPSAGEWAPVIARVAAGLREMAERREREMRG